MKKPKEGNAFFFVDESGDPTFYNRRGKCIVDTSGCSPILILGFMETQDPKPLRQAVLELRTQVVNDPLLAVLPSADKTAVAFHANTDAPEVRYLFVSLLHRLEFKTQLIVADKNEQLFRQRYGCKENRFYDDLVTRVFERVLHRFKHNELVFAARGSRARRKPLEKAIWRAKGRFERKFNVGRDVTTFEVRSQHPQGEPCLSIIDYMNWAVYRALIKGENRYYNLLRSKISLLRTRDLPELEHLYCRKRPLDATKPAPLGARLV